MNQIKAICKACGYSKTIFENEAVAEAKCDICSGEIKYEAAEDLNNKIEDDSKQNLVDNMIVNELELMLKDCGNQKTFEAIEDIHIPQKRVIWRKHFLNAGGFIPEDNNLLEKREDKLYLKEIL